MSGRHQTSVKKKHHGRDDIQAGVGGVGRDGGRRMGRGVTRVGTRRAVEADRKEGLSLLRRLSHTPGGSHNKKPLMSTAKDAGRGLS